MTPEIKEKLNKITEQEYEEFNDNDHFSGTISSNFDNEWMMNTDFKKYHHCVEFNTVIIVLEIHVNKFPRDLMFDICLLFDDITHT